MDAPEPQAGAPAPARTGLGSRDPWGLLASRTEARIGLGRAGGSLRTESVLDLRLAHALAVDAVHAPFDVSGVQQALRSAVLETERLATRAPDRGTYLLRPDLGRALEPRSAGLLREKAGAWGRRDLAILVSDGLSATAAERHAAQTVAELARILTGRGWTLYPILIAPFARVKLQDEVGGILGARHSVILLGERPGLSAHDSLGAYLTFEPRAERSDADRNCVSNIRDRGLRPGEAAREIAHLLLESRRLGLSGTRLRAAQGRLEATPARMG
jgi:ethanolamine ammonia-lyase small subunit